MVGFALFLRHVLALEIPTYTYRDHPLYTRSEYNETRPNPVVMNKYYRYRNKDKLTVSMLFAPNSASYGRLPTLEPLSTTPLDALYIPGSGVDSTEPFVEVHLNYAARVFMLLNGRGLHGKELTNLHSVQGLSSNWSGLFAIRSTHGGRISVGDAQRLGRELFLPSQAAVVESVVEKDAVLTVPHPGSIRVNGLNCSRMTLLFAQVEGEVNGSVRAFEYPGVPEKVVSPMSGEEVETVEVVPNQRCPEWLHDLHVTETRDAEVARAVGEPLVWRSWHSAIDSVYWCYYDHEHGSYPGQYRAMFGYTAWKTADSSTSDGRQDESHEGFKTFVLGLAHEKRIVVVTLHMHLSRGRRFVTRHHTSVVAVVNENWEVLMELHMKQDFGAALVTLWDGRTIGIDKHERMILQELQRRGKRSGRRFNVLKIDDGFPHSVDTRFALNSRTVSEATKGGLLHGIYERWNAQLNTCSWSKRRYVGGGRDEGMSFDVRDAATAIRDVNEVGRDKSVQKLWGASMDRFVRVMGDVEIGVSHCCLDILHGGSGIAQVNLRANGGVFYTDSYLRRVGSGAGGFAVRQFVRDGFEGVVIRGGRYFVTDAWYGAYALTNDSRIGGRRVMNAERAVLGELN
ncbi:hypothetical protein BWQ96_06321 [Gracilariopsis chorda]|uniref:Uncharacterized protein n=1 Tax=Gracilariopsis chorda TaxID=448386 RepID=A0A2V3IPE9_9FLOR|nr:hypothetical protein BWQ96_06321 [Gracilariopsis chorda]|eukprot:PXF43952.1 hypothetical protein BWQ96_06321 [Gracilariopsis chorda]